MPQAAVALVGLNPLVLVYGIGGAHNEPLVLLCSVAAVWLAVVGWQAGTAPWWDVGAGACAVLAAGFKPSAALLAPVVVLACRRRLPALGGAGSAGVLVLAVVGLVYGGHLPATNIQDGLVGPLSVPNVLAALAGHGGDDAPRPHPRPRGAGAGRRGRDRRRDVAALVAAGRRRLRDARGRPDAGLDDALVRLVGPALRRPRAHARADGRLRLRS